MIIDGSGMDFVLGNDGDSDFKTVAVEIVKIIEDAKGQRIYPRDEITNDFTIYSIKPGNPDSVVGFAVPDSVTEEQLRQKIAQIGTFSDLMDKKIVVGQSGIGAIYEYGVTRAMDEIKVTVDDYRSTTTVTIADSSSTGTRDIDMPRGMFYITEKPDPMAEGGENRVIIDTDGNTWNYTKTITETEYVWRQGDSNYGKGRHTVDGCSAVPEVLGYYGTWHNSDPGKNWDEPLFNEFLEFYVRNVYEPVVTAVTASKV